MYVSSLLDNSSVLKNVFGVSGVSIARVRAQAAPRRPAATGAARVAGGQRLPLPRAPQPARAAPPTARACACASCTGRRRRAVAGALRTLPRGRGREETVHARLQVPQHKLLQGDEKRLPLHLTGRRSGRAGRLRAPREVDQKETQECRE
jgi:hypothetical protein